MIPLAARFAAKSLGLRSRNLTTHSSKSATVAITSGFALGEDVLAFSDDAGPISASYDADNGILTLTGSASLAAYEAALQSVTYANTSDDPSTMIRTLSFTVNDGEADSNTVTRDINITPVNDAPTGLPTSMLDNGTEDVAYTVAEVNLLAGFSDAEDDALHIANLAASNGTVTDNGDGTYTITPTADFNGAMTLTYDVADVNGGRLAVRHKPTRWIPSMMRRCLLASNHERWSIQRTTQQRR